MTDLLEVVNAMTPDESAVAYKVLDACSRPLTAREIEHALRKVGVQKPRAVLFASALKGFAIVAVVGPEQ